MQFLNYMITLRTKIKQYFLGLLLPAMLIPCAVFGLSTPSIDECNDNVQCLRFRSWGFSMDIAKHGDHLKKIMDITNIDTNRHTRESFLHAIDSNWSPHSSDTEFSEHKSEILPETIKLGMNTPINEIPKYLPSEFKLQFFILGSHPKQLCSLLGELVQFQSYIHQTLLFGSSTPAYEEDDYLYCSALNAQQILALKNIATHSKLISEKDIMAVYFNNIDLNSSFPAITNTQQGKHEALFSNNQQMLLYLKANPQILKLRLSIIIAAPQPYMPEAVSILKKTLQDPTIYRFSRVTDFNIYESLNALRSWLKTDSSLTQ